MALTPDQVETLHQVIDSFEVAEVEFTKEGATHLASRMIRSADLVRKFFKEVR